MSSRSSKQSSKRKRPSPPGSLGGLLGGAWQQALSGELRDRAAQREAERCRRQRAAAARARAAAEAKQRAADEARARAEAARHARAQADALSAEEGRLSSALRRACEKRLLHEWRYLNYAHLRERLRPPVIELDTAASRWGSWDERTRTIAIAERLVLERPWGAVIEVLRHELAHQVVSELFPAENALPHGEAFRRACAMVAADPRASGDPDAAPRAEAPTDDEARQLRRIRGLLALAESVNQHEAEAALAKANELLLKYNLELAAAERDRGYVVREVGGTFSRRPKHVQLLAGIVTSHFYCEAIWLDHYDARTGKTLKVLELCGTQENTDLASYVWDEVLKSAEQLWKRHKRAESIRGNRDRRRFVEGVVAGYGRRLDREKRRLADERALVWVGDPKLEAFYRQRNPRVASESISVRGGEAFEAGRAAGESLRITRGVSHDRGDRGLALPG